MSEKSTVVSIVDKIETIEELKEFATAQYKTMIIQSKKITELEREREKLLSKVIELEKTQTVNSALSIQNDGMSDEETTCVVQLALLRRTALERELTLEETKKVETFVKTLHAIRGHAPKVKEDGVGNLSDADLIKAMQDLKTTNKEPQ